MPNTPGSSRKRLKNGLLLEQNQVLQELQQHPDWKAACDAVGVEHAKFRRWLREDATFITAYDDLHEGTLDAVRKQLEASTQKAAESFDEALDATKDIALDFECPHCKNKVHITAQIPDHKIRMKAGETVLKVSKILKEVTEHQGTVTIAQLPLHLQLAWAAHRRNQSIPPSAYDELKQLGFIKELPAPKEEATEAEWHEIDSSDE